jgi:hypothetical protein
MVSSLEEPSPNAIAPLKIEIVYVHHNVIDTFHL